MSQAYDAIVVGARCAGSPTAMLLARRGHRVLLVDRATFPSDTISTHLIHPPGVASLERWGLLDPVIATGSPAIDTYAFDFGPFTISGTPGTDETPAAYAPRRTALDKLLVDAASEAGAEVRERFTVESLVVEDGRVVGIRGHGKGGKTVTELARVVIGADGRYSLVADAVGAQEYNVKPQLQVSYYTYWSGLPMNGRFETAIRPGLGYAAWPTNDDLTLVIAGRSIDEFDAVRQDIEGTYLETSSRLPRSLPTGFEAQSARSASSAPRFGATSASLSAPAGLWSATRATTRTSSRPRASTTPSATPSCARRRSTRHSRAGGASRTLWASTRRVETSVSCPCTSSPPTSRR